MEKNWFIKSISKLKGSNLSVADDFSRDVEETRKALRQQRRSGKFVVT